MVIAEEQSLLQLFAEIVPEGQWQELQGVQRRTFHEQNMTVAVA